MYEYISVLICIIGAVNNHLLYKTSSRSIASESVGRQPCAPVPYFALLITCIVYLTRPGTLCAYAINKITYLTYLYQVPYVRIRR